MPAPTVLVAPEPKVFAILMPGSRVMELKVLAEPSGSGSVRPEVGQTWPR